MKDIDPLRLCLVGCANQLCSICAGALVDPGFCHLLLVGSLRQSPGSYVDAGTLHVGYCLDSAVKEHHIFRPPAAACSSFHNCGDGENQCMPPIVFPDPRYTPPVHDRAEFCVGVLDATVRSSQEGIISHVIVLEEMPADCRGWAVGLLNTGSACGTGLGLLLFGVSDGAWRLMYALSILPLIGIGFIRRHLPETRRWSAVNTQEIDKEELEVQSLHLPPVTPLRLGSPTEEPTAAAKRCQLKRFSKVKRQHLFCILASFLGAFFPSAANFYASKQIQVVHGFGAAGFAKLSLIGGILALSAFIIAGYLGDRYGRKLLGVSGILLKAMTDFMFYSISPGKAYSVHLIVSVFCVRTALGMALDTTFQAMGGEVFPTSGRTSAQGLLTGRPPNVRVLALRAPDTRLSDFLGTSEATRLMACGQMITALIIAVGFPETHGRELEDINS
eukprot:s4380_g1.t8